MSGTLLFRGYHNMLFSYGPVYQARVSITARNARTDALKHALTDEEPENIIGGRRHNINKKIISNTAAT